MKLYYFPGACSLSPHIALREAGLAFEPVLSNLKSHTLADGADFYGVNPLGYVPMLELDDGTRLRETTWRATPYRERVAARPGVQEAMKAEGLLT